MKLILLAVLLGLAPLARGRGENDEDTAVPGMIPSGSLMLFYDSTGPLSFVTMTPKDKPANAPDLGVVHGSSCQRGLSIPISADVRGTSISGAYGDGSFMKALAAIKAAKPDAAGIYDVRMDMRVFSILGIYRKLCTEVTARAFGAAK